MIAVLIFVYSLSYITVGEFSVISMLAPPLIGILGWIFLGEKYSLSDFLTACFSFLGVILIVKPGLLLPGYSEEQTQKTEK